MPFFCPIGPSKSKKCSSKSVANIPSSKSQSTSNQHATSSLLRYVMREFHAIAVDELSVLPGDLVLYEFTDTSDEWTHVTSLRTSKRGYVPSDILSSDLRRTSPRRKKMPRSEANNHDQLDPNDAQSKEPSFKSADNIRIVPQHHHHAQDDPVAPSLLQSLQGSSGKQSFPRYPDLPAYFNLRAPHAHFEPSFKSADNIRLVPQQNHLAQDDPVAPSLLQSLQGSSGKQSFPRYPDLPAYFNLRAPHAHFEHLEPEILPFHRQNLGNYLVTHNFVARAENDLSVTLGEYVTLFNRDDKDWFWVRRNHDHMEGFVPSDYMCESEQVRSILTEGNSMFHTYMNHRPDKESSPALGF